MADPSQYPALPAHWRSCLSAFWVQPGMPLRVDVRAVSLWRPWVPTEERTYNSFEHAYLAIKYYWVKRVDIAEQFSLESNSDLSKAHGSVAFKHRRVASMHENCFLGWKAHIPYVKLALYEVKFRNPLRPEHHVLLGTRNAQLWNIVPRTADKRSTMLESVRAHLQAPARVPWPTVAAHRFIVSSSKRAKT